MGSIQSQHGLRSQNANRMLTLFRKNCFDGKNPKSLVPTMKTPETPVKSRASGVLKGAEKRSKCPKRHPLPTTRNQFASNRTWVRIPPAAPKQKATAKAVAFCFGTHCPKGGSTLRYSNARGGRAAPAPRFLPAVKTLVRRTHAVGQKGRWSLQRSRQSKISILPFLSAAKDLSGCPSFFHV